MDISPADWDGLQALAGRVGLSTERVGILRRRVEDTGPRPGGPFTLIVGRPDAGIELLLARWLAPEAVDELRKVGDRPLVIGANPGEVKPRLGVWPGWQSSKMTAGHLIVVRTAGKPSADVIAQIQSLGYVDQVVIVTRLGQPLHMNEREIVQALAGLAATVRVLLVGIPGEEPTENELTEVTAFASNQMRQCGYREGRCLGAGVWFTGGEARPGCLPDVSAFLMVDPTQVAAGRTGMIRNAVVAVLAEIREKADKAPVAYATIADDECDRLVKELGSYLADLGRELTRQIDKPGTATTETLRRYALDALKSWGAYASIEGHWMKYVEKVRPGTQAAFFAEAESALSLLDFQPGTKPAEVAAQAESSPMVDRLIIEAKRAGVGLAVGVAALIGTGIGLGPDGLDLKPAMVANILGYVALGVGGVLGYSLARPFFPVPTPAERPEPAPVVAPALSGWVQIERRLTGWFSDHIRAKPASPVEECQALAMRFGAAELYA
ncbi:MAG: hypothetical protein HYR84_03345 [Planctomycetes bacterium]|nr:hypothetical protein [Planctomycetota bacterium]